MKDWNLGLVDKLELVENWVLDGREEFFIRFFKVGLVCVIFGVLVEKFGLGGICVIDFFWGIFLIEEGCFWSWDFGEILLFSEECDRFNFFCELNFWLWLFWFGNCCL